MTMPDCPHGFDCLLCALTRYKEAYGLSTETLLQRDLDLMETTRKLDDALEQLKCLAHNHPSGNTTQL